MIKTLICIDRDGTLIYDEKEHLYLGRDNGWKAKVKLLPYVVEGMRRLKAIPDAAVYMITNQPGVAITDFPLLTLERADEVCRYILEKIKDIGGRIDGYFLCPHANQAYVKKYTQYHFDERLVCECSCIKPDLGMIFDALRSEGVTPGSVSIYMIGDRATDVRTALNMGGTGILVPFENQQGEDQEVNKIKDQSRVYIAKNLLDAAEFITFHTRSGKR